MNKLLLLMFVIALCIHTQAFDKRDRFSGLYKAHASATMGKGNVFLSLYGRGFLWDNQAAQKSPTLYPHGELGLGLTDYAQISGGLQIFTTRPSQAFATLKLTLPNNKNIRFLGTAISLSMVRNLASEFKSNGFRYRNEGFSPDFFLMGNEQVITYFRALALFDLEIIRLSAYLPFKFYFNAGVEWAPQSWMGEHVDEAISIQKRSLDNASESSFSGTTDFTKVLTVLGAELKTQYTDFFVELEFEPFYQQYKSLIYNEGKEKLWTRYNLVLESDEPQLKVVDIHLLESPLFVNLGGRLKYANGTSLHGGISWLLSAEQGAKIGPCVRNPECKSGATDGYSPFFPQWRIFGGLKYPLKFKQTSAELYRTYLLRKTRIFRKVIDIDFKLDKDKDDEGDPIDYEQEIKKRAAAIEQQRKKAKNEKLD